MPVFIIARNGLKGFKSHVFFCYLYNAMFFVLLVGRKCEFILERLPVGKSDDSSILFSAIYRVEESAFSFVNTFARLYFE